MSDNIFEKASRLKLRFEAQRGLLQVEDLWGLPLTSKSGPSLDSIGSALLKDLRNEQEESLVVSKVETKVVTENRLRLEIIKHIIQVRQAEIARQEEYQVVLEKRKKLDSLIAMKKDQELSSLSLEELQKQRDSL